MTFLFFMIENEELSELYRLRDMYQTRVDTGKGDKNLKRTYKIMLDSILQQINKLEIKKKN